ncbi:serine/threonine-protein kinase [Streptomyces sp. NPDC058067]|uniref:serine/threonine-protein kinase n=1 Tax=Streptomyces sp. NPDC058067 TaxID=3346324 RepID=UPI0036EE07E2
MVRLAGYRLVTQLGDGAVGTAHLARSAAGHVVVVRAVHRHLAADPWFRERFRWEAAAARAVRGPATAAVLDADPDAEVPWLAVEYCAGPSLSEAVAVLGPPVPGDLAGLGATLAGALAAIHATGLVHRDLKPANVVVTAAGPKVIDFGLAKALAPGDGTRTDTGRRLGSPGFLAPEQITGATEPGPPADVFALGALLALCSTGRNPHGAGNGPEALHRTLHDEPDLLGVPDQEWAAFLSRCLAKSPYARPMVPEVLQWCAARATPRAWWQDPEPAALIEVHEESLAERLTTEGDDDVHGDGGHVGAEGPPAWYGGAVGQRPQSPLRQWDAPDVPWS